MAQNYATKYASKVAERFKEESLTESAVNQDYDWTGVQSVQVYSVDTVSLVDYTRSSTNRYGTPSELGTSIQEMKVEEDKSFTFTIDRGNYNEEQMVTEAGKALRRQIDEVVVPYVDEYRLGVFDTAAQGKAHWAGTTAATDATNAYNIVLELGEILDEDSVPRANRKLFITPSVFKFLKQDDSFLLASEMSQKVKFNGQVGEIDGNAVIKVPSSYMPTNTDMIMVHPSVTVAPRKLEDYKTHDNPPGINGWLVEGRMLHDAFALDAKVDGLAVHNTSPST